MSEYWSTNLRMLEGKDPALAAELAETAAHPGLSVEPARQESAASGTLATDGAGGRRITLASRHRPLAEAERFAEQVDVEEHAVVVVLGVGLGHHVAAAAKRAGRRALVVAYEPDPSVLRAVLERTDASGWLGAANVALFTGAADATTLNQRLSGRFLDVATGVQILTHPPSRQLHGEALGRFSEQFRQFVAYIRTTVATTLVNSTVTCRNLVSNLGQYAAGATIDELKGAAAGYPAVLVAAGPSLAKNVHRLAEPGVRDRVVIIAAQTVLRPLLERGVRPHFVTALDFHEISRRFYEGLPALDDVTLVAEPKANPAILDAFPGPIRVCRSGFLETLLTPHNRPIDAIPGGSTVAHLSFYLAQYLGCDPIVLTGQDLGFSDGLYYCPGTSIHDVWTPELSAFNTLEMMEWKRIVRHRNHLEKVTDINGRSIYTDEQMLTYLRQFERDFAEAEQRVIDATEGGVPKRHTEAMSLAAALAGHATNALPALPVPPRELDPMALTRIAGHLDQRIAEVRELRLISEQTVPILRKMLERQDDERKMASLFRQLEKKKQRVAELSQAFRMVNEVTQVAAYRRHMADRAIGGPAEIEAVEKQRKQLERDLDNVTWLIDGCSETLKYFEAAAERLSEQLAAARRGMGEGLRLATEARS